MPLPRYAGRWLAVLCLLVAQVFPGHAAAETARQFLEKIYRPYIGANGDGLDYQSPVKSRLYFDKELDDLFQKDRKDAKGEVGRLDFDPFVEAQDFTIEAVRIDVTNEQDGRAQGTVTFANIGHRTAVKYELVQTPKGWRIANILWPGSKTDLKSVLSRPFP